MRAFFLLLFAAFAAVGAADQTFAGAKSCERCHQEIQHKWANARHSKMVQPATAQAVRGDFLKGAITLRGQRYTLAKRAGAFYITESYLSGRSTEHRIDYTLGNRRIQHYLTTLPDGRIVVLPPSWDILRKQWFHNFDIGDPDESGDVEVQLWNKNCFSCHVSEEKKNFDSDQKTYRTEWKDFGINCERCHGPGSEHITSEAKKPRQDIVVQTRLTPERNTMVCAQCHSFRDIFIQGYQAGGNYYDHFVPILEFAQPLDKDPAYWPDGRPRRFSTDAFGFWQSQCFLKGGATCLNCHADAHDTSIEKSPQLRPDAAAICTTCHSAIGKNVTAHTHHGEKSTGSSCVECHMPRTVLSVKAKIRDHAITIPSPENTTRHAIPNACNECHAEHSASWAKERMTAWWGEKPGPWVRRADAFAAARERRPEAVDQLLAIATDPKEIPFARANALGYLATRGTDPRVFPVLTWALGEDHPLVRVEAALGLAGGGANKSAAAQALVAALNDGAATVRLAAAVSLASIGIRDLPGEDGVRFNKAKELYAGRAEFNTDDASQQFAAGRFFLLTNNPARAETAFRNALALEPSTPATYFLASALAQLGKYADARVMLDTIRPSDPQYSSAQALRRTIADR